MSAIHARSAGPLRMLVAALVGSLGVIAGLVPAAPAGAVALPVPPGYRVVAREALGPGVEHLTLRQEAPAVDVHVARLAAGAGSRLRPVLGGDALSRPETTSSMCARTKCVAAVNGDFFDTSTGRPIGAMVAGGELVATPDGEHILLRIDGQGRPTLRPGIDWAVAVRTGDGQALGVQAVNRPAAADGVTLYSQRWGTSTGTAAGTVELALDLVAPSAPVLPSGLTTGRLGAPGTAGNATIGVGQVVLAGNGPGAEALAALAQRAAGGLVVLDVNLGGTMSAIGGSPQLLEGGALDYPVDNTDSFTADQHARTMFGITATGEMLLVTADRTASSAGLTLLQAANLMRALGATDAVNLDGGGSTTFVTGGVVRNRPSTQERPVASSLALTPADPVTALLDPVVRSLGGLLNLGA